MSPTPTERITLDRLPSLPDGIAATDSRDLLDQVESLQDALIVIPEAERSFRFACERRIGLCVQELWERRGGGGR